MTRGSTRWIYEPDVFCNLSLDLYVQLTDNLLEMCTLEILFNIIICYCIPDCRSFQVTRQNVETSRGCLRNFLKVNNL